MNTDELFQAVREWGRSHGINNPDKQTIKLQEECGELAHEICRGHYDSNELRDAIGDIQVVLTILADMLGIDNRECLREAYEVIKVRTGRTLNGSFIKDDE